MTPAPAADRSFEVVIGPEPHRVAELRHAAASFLRYRNVPELLAQDVVVVVSDLVTNAIEHGRGSVSLRVRHIGENLLVETIDSNPSPARLRAPTADEECGRGLFLVACLAWNWGVSEDGRTTWAAFRAPLGRSR
ncbi:ATP-binding protein [Streptomyces sp. BpilaLS-43]|uniref:ATP-binding protein n=1 Tax=Streptomyces sp. BpilaLS-43 TaxID=1839778 RepID=UPI00210E923A|nr:ATP-binding protein [Streptomyces sp. BpilaLS-43]